MKKLVKKLPHEVRKRDVIIRFADPIWLGDKLLVAVVYKRRKKPWRFMKKPRKYLQRELCLFPWVEAVRDKGALRRIVKLLVK